MNAVGSRWTNAVAINTPVPKCCDMNMNLAAPVFREALFDTRGKPQADPKIISPPYTIYLDRDSIIQPMLRININNKAKTCAEVL